MKPKFAMLSFFLWLVWVGLGSAADKPAVILMTHDSFAVSEGLFTDFEARHNLTVRILKSGDAGAALNQAILSKQNPLGDVFFGVDNTFMGRALRADIFDVYSIPRAGSDTRCAQA